jgi:hypothetical protein
MGFPPPCHPLSDGGVDFPLAILVLTCENFDQVSEVPARPDETEMGDFLSIHHEQTCRLPSADHGLVHPKIACGPEGI